MNGARELGPKPNEGLEWYIYIYIYMDGVYLLKYLKSSSEYNNGNEPYVNKPE